PAPKRTGAQSVCFRTWAGLLNRATARIAISERVKDFIGLRAALPATNPWLPESPKLRLPTVPSYGTVFNRLNGLLGLSGSSHAHCLVQDRDRRRRHVHGCGPDP